MVLNHSWCVAPHSSQPSQPPQPPLRSPHTHHLSPRMRTHMSSPNSSVTCSEKTNTAMCVLSNPTSKYSTICKTHGGAVTPSWDGCSQDLPQSASLLIQLDLQVENQLRAGKWKFPDTDIFTKKTLYAGGGEMQKFLDLDFPFLFLFSTSRNFHVPPPCIIVGTWKSPHLDISVTSNFQLCTQ